jgi:hypothetical protein
MRLTARVKDSELVTLDDMATPEETEELRRALEDD